MVGKLPSQSCVTCKLGGKHCLTKDKIAMDWLVDLESTCSALGTADGRDRYIRDDECLEGVKDLIRYLRRDDDNHEVRRRLGEIQVLQSDLIPLIKDATKRQADAELLDLVLRLVVNLTNPEILLFREELPEDKATRNYYLQLQAHRQAYKEAFVDEALWRALADKLGELLAVEAADRGEEEQLVVERILILVRNVLQVPRDSRSERRTDDDASTHDQVLWVLHKSGMEDLMLYVCSSDDEAQYCLHGLEIISLMFREQEPKALAAANFQRSKEEKAGDERALQQASLLEQENRKRRQATYSGRHSRFGGTFVVKGVEAIADDKKLIWHRPLQAIDAMNFDAEKRPRKTAKNRETPADSESTSRYIRMYKGFRTHKN